MALKEKKYLKTFSIHETDLKTVKSFKKTILQYKHLENIINILAAHEFNNFKQNIKAKDKNNILYLLLNKIIMKAVLKNNLGGDKTSHNIAQVNQHFNESHPKHELFKQAKEACLNLNDKNIGEIIGRLYKDWSNFFTANNKFYKANNKSLGKPSYPKPKRLSKVFNYSVPLEVSKFSLSRENKGLLGINLAKGMTYIKYYHADKSKPNNNKPDYLNKKINSVTVSLSHGHIYYNLQYIDQEKYLKEKNNEKNSLSNEVNLHNKHPEKVAGLDIGVINTASIFVNDKGTNSIIISGKELISYNCNFNKSLSRLAENLAKEVTVYKTIINKQDKEQKIPARYSKKGKKLIYRRSQLFERRRLFMSDYMNKLSKKITQYLDMNKVTKLVISKNLSFTKTEGSIKMGKKTKQKFYQIPFGNLLNLLEAKLENKEIEVVDINEAYTSKTSSLSADVVNIQAKAIRKEEILPNDLNGSRGSKKKGNLNNPLGRGLFKDIVINKVINADLNAAANHIKVGLKNIKMNVDLWKYCNPKKIKSNHEFDRFLKSYQIVDIQRA